ncbi:MAG: Fic family protein [Thaumarchaeota archaeon]|nr:Fic family protein [Nitrososphaerota archaeon]
MTKYASLPDLIHHRILEKKRKLGYIGKLDSNKIRRIEERMQIDFVYNSNKIEGSTLSRGETELVLKGMTVGKKNIPQALAGKEIGHILAAQNHPLAIDLVKKIAFNKTYKITEGDIRTLHRMAMNRIIATAGKYRDHDELAVHGAGFTPPLFYDIPKHMKELVHLINNNADELRPIEHAAQVHYDFVWIHPFEDGNGRIARLLMNLLLVRNDYPFTVIKQVEKPKYLRTLKEMDIEGDFEPFLIFVARSVEQTLDTYLAALESKRKSKFLPLSILAKGTPHSADYWSLLARKGRIDAIKEGKTWKTTKQVIATYLAEQRN